MKTWTERHLERVRDRIEGVTLAARFVRLLGDESMRWTFTRLCIEVAQLGLLEGYLEERLAR